MLSVRPKQYAATILNGGKVKANRDLVQQLRALAAQHNLLMQAVAGFSGHALNERCDGLSQAAAR